MAGTNTKSTLADTNPFVRLPNAARFRAALIGGVKSIKATVYLNGNDGNLLTKVDCDSDDDAMILLQEINEQLDAIVI